MKTAIITGVSGQDGSYLAELLLKKNYKVIGLDRRSVRELNHWRHRYLGISNDIIYEECEITEFNNIVDVLRKYKINEFYNLAAQSFVKSSFNSPIYTAEATGIAVLKILDAIRLVNKKIKFYQASSSEMFGKIAHKKQGENTPFHPRSPYGVAKVFAHYTTQNYREAYNMFAVNGILFNHESPLRGEEFVTKKVTRGIYEYVKYKKSFQVGNIYSKRDWGYAKDYVEAMWKMLQQKKPKDYVIATEKNYSIKDYINKTCKVAGIKSKWVGKGLNEKLIDIKNQKTIISISKKFFRPSEVDILLGDTSLARKHLKWKNKTSFNQLVEIMYHSMPSLENLG